MKAAQNPKLVVKQVPESEVPTEVLADSIVAIAAGIKKLRTGRLNDRALYLLIQNAAPNVGGKYRSAPLSIKSIEAVFEGIAALESTYLRKKPLPL